jgi:arylsulfatase A
MKTLIRLCGCLALLAAPWAHGAPVSRPNIILILADDLGWTGVGCYGSPLYQTPHIDRLAREGMKFTQAYTAGPLCSPTRASILTGKYPARLHLTEWIPGEVFPFAKMLPPQDWIKRIPVGEMTFLQKLKTVGYTTASVGKWHLGEEARPEEYGFDYSIGGGGRGSPPGGYFSPYKNRYLPDGPEGEFLSDRLTDEALKWVETNKSRPFFLYLPHFAVHTPIQGKADIAAKYRTLIEASPNPLHTNATYAALTESVDDSVGRILEKLDELKLADRTIVIFTSDNGGSIQYSSNAPLRSGKASNYEGGVRVPLIVRWLGVVKPGSVCETPVSSPDFYPTFLEIAGVKDDPKHIRDGQSLVPLLRQTKSLKPRELYWHYPHYNNGNGAACVPFTAVREGDLKLLHFHEDGRFELYNLKHDVGETKNLASAQPRDVRRLAAKIDQWRKDVNAQMPSLNPNHDPARAWEMLRRNTKPPGNPNR